MQLPYTDRTEAGRTLAQSMDHYAGRDDVLILALPRGGVPVAVELARALHAPVDLMIVRKLGVPGHEELAMGAVATGGGWVTNRDVVRSLNIDDQTIHRELERQRREIDHRQRLYRGDRPPPDLAGKCVILVDDGLATGSTMRAALRAARQQDPARLLAVVPVAPPEAIRILELDADEVICPLQPPQFFAVSQWYQHFPQTSDEEVSRLLGEAWSADAQSPGR